MAFDLIAELEQLVDALHADAAEYALCGGLALAVHGHPRATKDIDLLVRAEAVPHLLALAKAHGYDIPAGPMLFAAGTPFERRIHRVSKLDEAGRLLSLDLIVVGDALESVWASRVVAQWNERAVRVVSRDGLVAMKRIAGRPQDVADIAVLEGSDADGEAG